MWELKRKDPSILTGYLIYHNYFREDQALENKTRRSLSSNVSIDNFTEINNTLVKYSMSSTDHIAHYSSASKCHTL
jgi:hypothetical protein